ncbi:MAG TPA: hypothetical protein VIL42_01980 [Sphingomicrobium sp.]|jgi:hypothetical protein
MRALFTLALLVAVAGCSSQAAKEDKLDDAANVSTPEAAEVLNGAAENGMDPDAALNAAAEAQAGNAGSENSQ